MREHTGRQGGERERPGEWRGAAAGSRARAAGAGPGGGLGGAGRSRGSPPGPGSGGRGGRASGPRVRAAGGREPGPRRMAGSRVSVWESAGLGSGPGAVAALSDPYSLFPFGLRLTHVQNGENRV